MLLNAKVASAQCLSVPQVQNIVLRLNNGISPSQNNQLRQELLEMRQSVFIALREKKSGYQKIQQPINEKKASLATESIGKTKEAEYAQYETRFCEMLKTYGFLSNSLVGGDGSNAGLYLLKQLTSLEFQITMLPAVSAAINKNELAKNEDYAAFIDRLRVWNGRKQLYGTQVYLKDDLLILGPIDNEQMVDKRRSSCNMPPLADELKYIERVYKTAIMRERKAIEGEKEQKEFARELADDLPPLDIASEKDDVIRVQSELVSLNVNVFNKKPRSLPLGLDAADFKIYEDGREEQVSFFERTEKPFDLVLLLDLSGSTAEKQGLIRKATKRFIDLARPIDRISIVTFTNKVNIVIPLSIDRVQLLKSIDKIKDTGESNVWDSLYYTLQNSFGEKSSDRRRAVVIMSDGVDNTLTRLDIAINTKNKWPEGSEVSFAQLLETVQNNDIIVIPIDLDTEGKLTYSERTYRIARRTLSILAEESGGHVYYAKKLENLNGIYENILNDLRAVYSVGYIPANEAPNGSWHDLKIEIPRRPDLVAHTRKGYFTRK